VDIGHLKHDREPAGTQSSFDDIAVAERPLHAGPQRVELRGGWCRWVLGQ
jgi:hypothetical protein